ncbi:MAG: hypothetical protein IT326_02780 [Anaerolineae bacterium]|nr:hypothetical protein [Anaerolineae bacterium]
MKPSLPLPAALFCLLLLSGCNFPGVFPAVAPEGETQDTIVLPPATALIEPTAVATDPIVYQPDLRRLTDPGCCVQPFWSADGRTVLFIDRPPGTDLTGIYGVPLSGGPVELFSSQVGLLSPDGHMLAYLNESGETTLQDVGTGETWVIPNGGQRVFFSPGGSLLAWAETGAGNFDTRPVTVSVSAWDGSGPRVVANLYGGGVMGWLDDDRLLLSGRRGVNEPSTLFSLSIPDGAVTELLRGQRVWSVAIAPGGGWIAYTVNFASDGDPEAEGLWVASTDGATRYRLEQYGGFQWRDGRRLLVIPFEMDVPGYSLWQFDVLTGQGTALTDPSMVSFRIESGNWLVSPVGDAIVFLNPEDRALWTFGLPGVTP